VAGAGNVISGNDGDGVHIFGTAATGNIVQGNYIGPDVNGTADLGNLGDGMYVTGPSNTIGGTVAGAGNVISGNDLRGVHILGLAATGNVVQGNYIGTDVTGMNDLGNSLDGVLVSYAPNNAIGGTVAGAGNIISGNDRHGIFIWTVIGGNVVQGNTIGTDVTGTVGLGNSSDGVFIIDTANSTIGGTVAGARNLISDNGEYGVHIVGGTGHRVQGNYIGTDVNGAADLGNSQSGVFLNNASDTTIGGTVAEARNLISGNDQRGVYIFGNAATGNVIQGNTIGPDVTGAAALGNSWDGVYIAGASNNTIGGTVAGAGNTIVSNGGDGVSVQSGAGNGVLSNPIFANGDLGIDLGSDGVTANDTGDGDAGANELQNFPVLTSAISDGGGTTIQGTLNSLASTAFRIEFFANTACDSTNYGEGETYLGSTDVNTDGAGNVSFTANFAIAVTGGFVTATATGPANNTSEFSVCLPVLSPTPVPAPPPSGGGGGDDGDEDDDDDEPTPVPPPQAQEFDCWPWLVTVPPLAVPNAGTICQPSLDTPLLAASTFRYLGHSTDVTIEDAAGMPVSQFNPPLTICFRYQQPQLDDVGGDPANFLIQTFHNGTWESLTTTPAGDPSPSVLGRVCAPVEHLTLFALFAREGATPAKVASADNSLASVKYLPETGVQAVSHWPEVVLGVLAIVVVGGSLLIRKCQ
jgi:parallel beta-helix repeat protein